MDALLLWKPLEAFAAENFPHDPPFDRGASDVDIARLAVAIGPGLPSLLTALLRVHDGGAAPVLPQGAWFRSAADIVETWGVLGAVAEENFQECPATLVDAETHVDAPFHPRWVPFATRDDFELFLDLAPGPRGTIGQVLFQVDEASVVVVAASLETFLLRWTALLSSDRLRFTSDVGYPLPADGSSFVALLTG